MQQNTDRLDAQSARFHADQRQRDLENRAYREQQLKKKDEDDRRRYIEDERKKVEEERYRKTKEEEYRYRRNKRNDRKMLRKYGGSNSNSNSNSYSYSAGSYGGSNSCSGGSYGRSNNISCTTLPPLRGVATSPSYNHGSGLAGSKPGNGLFIIIRK